jgi:hypothetical protein
MLPHFEYAMTVHNNLPLLFSLRDDAISDMTQEKIDTKAFVMLNKNKHPTTTAKIM